MVLPLTTISDIVSESDFSDTDQDRSSDDEDDTLVESDDVLTGDELGRNGEGGRGGAVSVVHTPARFTSTANIVLIHARPVLEMQGAAASGNSVSGEANPIATVPSGNEVLLGGGVTG